MGAYLDLLAARTRLVGSVLCLGLDPDPSALPPALGTGLAGLERFCSLLLEAALPHVAAVKPNLAFFEAFGSGGLAALERLMARIPPDVPIIADAKRGDIGSTAARHAVATLRRLGAHAVTASPYLGSEAIEPLLGRSDRFVYVLCRTSNPGAGEVQASRSPPPAAGRPAEPLYGRVAARVALMAPSYGTIGLVVGATAPAELAQIREVADTWRSWCPASAPRAGTLRPWRPGRPRRGRPGPWPAVGCWSRVRGIAAAALGATTPRPRGCGRGRGRARLGATR